MANTSVNDLITRLEELTVQFAQFHAALVQIQEKPEKTTEEEKTIKELQNKIKAVVIESKKIKEKIAKIQKDLENQTKKAHEQAKKAAKEACDTRKEDVQRLLAEAERLRRVQEVLSQKNMSNTPALTAWFRRHPKISTAVALSVTTITIAVGLRGCKDKDGIWTPPAIEEQAKRYKELTPLQKAIYDGAAEIGVVSKEPITEAKKQEEQAPKSKIGQVLEDASKKPTSDKVQERYDNADPLVKALSKLFKTAPKDGNGGME